MTDVPDHDDYTSKGLNDLPGLNADLLLWDDVLQRSIELSSMGIRVDKALLRQVKQENQEQRLELYFHKRLLDDTFHSFYRWRYRSVTLMHVLFAGAHIGEIQASIWPEEMRRECTALGAIHLFNSL